MFEHLLVTFRQRALLFELARNDVRARYTGSVLGVAWAFVQPLLTIALNLFIYRMGFRVSPPAEVPFVVWLVVGLAPWFLFVESMTLTTSAFLDYAYLVKKVRFDVSIVPTIKLAASSFVHAFVWLLVLGVAWASGFAPRLTWVLVPYYFVALALLVSGVSFLTSTIAAFFRDMGQAVGVGLQFLFWLTPVFWSMNDAPPGYVRWLRCNPLHHVIDGLREAVLLGRGFWEHPVRTAYFWAVVILVNVLGHALFRRARPHLSDVL